MYEMRWLFICMCLCTAVAGISLRCTSSLCSFRKSYGDYLYTIEGHKIIFNHWNAKNEQNSGKLRIDCQGWQAFDSIAMPQFDSVYHVSVVELINCPLPKGNTSLVSALAALNVTLQPVNKNLNLYLTQIPAVHLTPQHFVGLEDVTDLEVSYGVDPYQLPTPGFLTGMTHLRFLHLIGVRLPAGELYRLPHSIKRIWLSGDSMNFLPGTLLEIISETVTAMPKLRVLMLDQWKFNASEFTNSSHAKQQQNETYSLQSLQLINWNDVQLPPLERCNALLSLDIQRAKVEELPSRWVAACPLLKEISLENAEQLTSLPAKLLEGATALKRLSIRLTGIQYLPDGFLAGAPNLLELDLSDNKLRGTLPSGVFLGPALTSLSLEGSRLRTDSLAAVAPLTSLTQLNIGQNRNWYYDFCDADGYSPLRNLTLLKSLSLFEAPITRICRDWRENFTFLESLNLMGSSITELKFTDFLCIRDATVKNAKIKLSQSLHYLNFTRDNYESALAVPGSGITFKFEYNWRYPKRNVDCDCSSYWLRRAVGSKGRAIRVEGLTCANNRDFNQVTPEEMCPEEARNVA